MLLDGLRSILSPPVFWGASDGRSGVGSIPVVCVWGVCVVLPLFGFRSRTVQPVAQSLYQLSYPAHVRSMWVDKI